MRKRHSHWILSLALTSLLMTACGGTGSSDFVAPPPANPLYVRVSGSDTNSGANPANALRTIGKAMQLALDGYTIYVGGGTYFEGVTTARTGGSADGLMLLADQSGAKTGDAGPVVIDAGGNAVPVALTVAQSPGTVIDGFIMDNSADAGIVIKSNSNNLTIQNCVVFNNSGDGIRVQDSTHVTLFNNLVYGNAGIGVNITGSISGSSDASILNNTIAFHRSRGLTIGQSGVASKRAVLRNNIVQNNTGDASIKVFAPPPSSIPRSDEGYNEDFNLVLPFTVLPTTLPKGSHDLQADALFVEPGTGNFRLLAGSPAIDAGTSSGLSDSQVSILRGRTTTGTGLDVSSIDLGFHFLP